MATPLVVGVDLGGTHVAAAVLDANGKILGRKDESINRHEVPKVTLQRDVAGAIRAAIHEAGVDGASVGGIGMGLPGNIDRARGICRYSPNFRWKDVPVADFLNEVLDKPVHLLNDVRSHTLGEFHFGAGREVGSFAMLALGTGIGGGIVINRRLMEGAHSAGGEIGHITVDPDGPVCGCGNRGCVEALAAAPAIGRYGQEAAARGEAPGILRLAGSIDAISAATVSQAAEQGDPAALAIWEKTGRWIGLACCAIIGTIDPERILIGGKVARAGDMLLRPAREEVGLRFRMIPPGTTPIVPADLGDDAGLIGAGALALEYLGALAPAVAEPLPVG